MQRSWCKTKVGSIDLLSIRPSRQGCYLDFFQSTEPFSKISFFEELIDQEIYVDSPIVLSVDGMRYVIHSIVQPTVHAREA